MAIPEKIELKRGDMEFLAGLIKIYDIPPSARLCIERMLTSKGLTQADIKFLSKEGVRKARLSLEQFNLFEESPETVN